MGAIITQLSFQHRTKGYKAGYSIELESTEGIHLVDYLKSFNHWYSALEPAGGVGISPIHCLYIEKYILKRSILQCSKYEVVIGFVDFENFANTENTSETITVLSAYEKTTDNFGHYSFFSKPASGIIATGLNLNFKKNRVALSEDQFKHLKKINSTIGGRPIEMCSKRFNFVLEEIPLGQFKAPSELQEGIIDFESLN